MHLSSLVGFFSRSRRSKANTQLRARIQKQRRGLFIESLEDRSLLTIVSADNSSDALDELSSQNDLPAYISAQIPVAGPAIATDHSDYAAGATALITGNGFAGGEIVTLQVLHADTTQPAAGDNPWSVTADADGAFSTTWY